MRLLIIFIIISVAVEFPIFHMRIVYFSAKLFRDDDPKKADAICRILSGYFDLIPMEYTGTHHHRNSWAYINWLQTKDLIIVPSSVSFHNIKKYFCELYYRRNRNPSVRQ